LSNKEPSNFEQRNFKANSAPRLVIAPSNRDLSSAVDIGAGLGLDQEVLKISISSRFMDAAFAGVACGVSTGSAQASEHMFLMSFSLGLGFLPTHCDMVSANASAAICCSISSYHRNK
jgi:hypothetical protein